MTIKMERSEADIRLFLTTVAMLGNVNSPSRGIKTKMKRYRAEIRRGERSRDAWDKTISHVTGRLAPLKDWAIGKDTDTEVLKAAACMIDMMGIKSTVAKGKISKRDGEVLMVSAQAKHAEVGPTALDEYYPLEYVTRATWWV